MSVRWFGRDRGSAGSYSISVLVALSLNACLAPSTPDIQESDAIPPLLSLLEADPPVNQILDVTRDEELPISIPFRSEETVPEQIWALPRVNYRLTNETSLAPLTNVSEAGSFSQERVVSYAQPIDSSFAIGCQQFTLLVTHRSNIDETQRPNVPIDISRVAMATWWLRVSPQFSPGDPVEEVDPRLSECPKLAIGE